MRNVMNARMLGGLGIGVAGLACSVLALVTGQIWWAGAAGVCVLGAGLVTFRLARKLRRAEQMEPLARLLEVENDQLTARAEHFEAEAAQAVTARDSLVDAFHETSVRSAPPVRAGGIIDAASGLFNDQFFAITLEKRVSAARRGLRPLSIVLLEVVVIGPDGEQHPADPKVVAGGLLETLRTADTACRLADGHFALVLEETPENGAVWTVERVRRCLAELQPDQRMWAGLACYPAHAFDPEQILIQAREALHMAKEWNQDRIEVAALAPDQA